MKRRGKEIVRQKGFSLKNIRGQVWIETVIYTLIAFVLIGLILSYAKPKIEQLQDKTILEQSAEMMKQIDSTILGMGGAGNQRLLEIGIKKGTLNIDAIHDKMYFQLESQSEYSEPGKNVTDGSIVIDTEKKSGYNLVTLTIDYSASYDLKISGTDVLKTVSSASNAYKLSILNEGVNTNGKTILNISIS